MDGDKTLSLSIALWGFSELGVDIYDQGRVVDRRKIYNRLYHIAWWECPQPLGYQGFLTERYIDDTAK